jgi:uncharacterized RDD family membrane protein YckC
MLSPATYYRARETARADEVDGLQLATFTRRAVGFGIDFVLISIARKILEFLWSNYAPHQWERHTLINPLHVLDLIVLILYFCLALYIGNGQTIGKRVVRTRVISLTHNHITFCQALERSLGYGASFLEGGFGFAQFFIQRNRQCAHGRLAETIFIDTRESATRRVDCEKPANVVADTNYEIDRTGQTVTDDEIAPNSLLPPVSSPVRLIDAPE